MQSQEQYLIYSRVLHQLLLSAFSTKDRRPLIVPALRQRLWSFLGGIARQNGMRAIEIGGVDDHVHQQHHRKMTFKEEFLALLKKHRIPFDERYLCE